MTADVVQGMDGALLGTEDDDGVLIHFEREVISGFGNFARMPGEKPASAPEAGHVAPIDFLIGKELAGQRPTGLAARDK